MNYIFTSISVEIIQSQLITLWFEIMLVYKCYTTFWSVSHSQISRAYKIIILTPSVENRCSAKSHQSSLYLISSKTLPNPVEHNLKSTLMHLNVISVEAILNKLSQNLGNTQGLPVFLAFRGLEIYLFIVAENMQQRINFNCINQLPGRQCFISIPRRSDF